ncbi:PepSY domain-containing protein [Aquamicrobium zhengzhouense]|uniref:PepSY domain-containing protein n=1 Tax=Aquamicrobium zhengzhouense TaxID=2781738 RepID=A0ABS0SFJ7_9HYPH|nr:PepSY domain-containing protein [Aquamicrobium zhengzhouense]MBI1621203.1 PepSY domain-containing protein [Aquamicrobium zhengzhouense]
MIRSSLIAFALLAALAPAMADDDHDRARRALERGQILPLSRIIEIARKDTPGKIIDVELDDDDDRFVYEIELLDSRGRVIEMKLDAANGRVLEREIDD